MSAPITSPRLNALILSLVLALGCFVRAGDVETIDTDNFGKAEQILAEKILPKLGNDSAFVRPFEVKGGGANRDISNSLKERLKEKQKRVVSSGGDVDIRGNLNLLTDGTSAKRPIGVQIQTTVERVGEEPSVFNINVQDLTAVPMVKSGVFFKPPSGDPSTRSELTVDREKSIRPNPSSPYGVQLFVKGESSPRPINLESRTSAKLTLKKGQQFFVRVFNDTDYMAGVALSIDGVNRFRLYQDREGNKPTTDIVGPHSATDVRGWALNPMHDAEFIVSDPGDAVYRRLGFSDSDPDTCIIALDFAAVWRRGETPPPNEPRKEGSIVSGGIGVGAGDVIQAPKTIVQDLVVGRTRATVRIAYAEEGN